MLAQQGGSTFRPTGSSQGAGMGTRSGTGSTYSGASRGGSDGASSTSGQVFEQATAGISMSQGQSTGGSPGPSKGGAIGGSSTSSQQTAASMNANRQEGIGASRTYGTDPKSIHTKGPGMYGQHSEGQEYKGDMGQSSGSASSYNSGSPGIKSNPGGKQEQFRSSMSGQQGMKANSEQKAGEAWTRPSASTQNERSF